eukprot:TRINITY_DN23297_c0_g1_i1.p1 TRINITY_DN23297_c0_g1~~TRINITY_DN23297_c0_g1_i1.p1  ORF type:complete len:248 (-),score=32.58 TRINITY_DN23297_c0_g1_i1:343-1086(-)
MASSVCMSAPAGLVSPLVKDVSAKASFSSTSASVFVKQVKARTVCSASTSSDEQSFQQSAGKAAAALALAALFTSVPLVAPLDARADVAGLTPCKDSEAFAKREKGEIRTLTKRLKKYEADSAPALAINATIEKTQRRFAFYGKAGLLCGTDGLPHLIVDGDQAHLGEFVYPGIVFLYIAGWIGWVGREYLLLARESKKPTEKEIIIDVPVATSLLWKGFTWPLAALNALKNGTLIKDSADISVSPR